MAWISNNNYLNQSEMENNANIVIAYFRSQNIPDVVIAALLGNMQAESTINPGLTEHGAAVPRVWFSTMDSSKCFS